MVTWAYMGFVAAYAHDSGFVGVYEIFYCPRPGILASMGVYEIMTEKSPYFKESVGWKARIIFYMPKLDIKCGCNQ